MLRSARPPRAARAGSPGCSSRHPVPASLTTRLASRKDDRGQAGASGSRALGDAWVLRSHDRVASLVRVGLRPSRLSTPRLLELAGSGSLMKSVQRRGRGESGGDRLYKRTQRRTGSELCPLVPGRSMGSGLKALRVAAASLRWPGVAKRRPREVASTRFRGSRGRLVSSLGRKPVRAGTSAPTTPHR
jgi:hypothetical protein